MRGIRKLQALSPPHIVWSPADSESASPKWCGPHSFFEIHGISKTKTKTDQTKRLARYAERGEWKQQQLPRVIGKVAPSS